MAEIRFDFVGNADDLLREVDRVEGGLDEAGASSVDFARVGKAALGAVAAASAAAAASMALLARETLKLAASGNTYAKSAKKVGSSAEDIQKLEGAFGLLTDANIDASRVIQDFGRNLADARDGTGEAQDALEKLGLSAKDFAGLSIDRQIALVSDRFGGLRDSAEKSQVALDIFGRSGRELVPALDAGGKAILAATEQIEDAGIISNEMAAQSEVLTDAVFLLGKEFATLKRGAVGPLIPDMLELVGVITEAVQAAQNSDGLKTMAQFMVDVTHGAVLAAVELGRFLGLIEQVQRKSEGGVFTDSEEIREQVQQVNRLQNALDSAQAHAEANADATGAWRTGHLDAWETTLDQLRAAQVELKRLKAEAEGVAPVPPAVPESYRKITEAIEETADASDDAAERRALNIQFHLDRVREQAEAEKAALEEVAAEEERHSKARDAMAVERYNAELARIEGAKAARIRAAQDWTAVAAGTTAAVGGLVAALTDLEVSKTEEGSEAREAALKRAWEAQTAVDIAMAAVNIPLAISQAAAAPWPAAIGFMVAAGAAATAAFGGVVAKAAAGPSFHTGGLLREADVAGSAGGAGEVAVRAKVGEGFLSTTGVATAGGEDGVNALNRGQTPSGGESVTIIRFGTRTTEAIAHQQLRPMNGKMASALRGVRPKVGRSIPGRR